MEPSAWPGTIQAGASTLRPSKVSSTTGILKPPCSPPCAYSPYSTPKCRAVAGLIKAALSQVRVLLGFGHSCSQPLLANDPSKTVGSGAKANSKDSPV